MSWSNRNLGLRLLAESSHPYPRLHSSAAPRLSNLVMYFHTSRSCGAEILGWCLACPGEVHLRENHRAAKLSGAGICGHTLV